jgi:hypothetical protein
MQITFKLGLPRIVQNFRYVTVFINVNVKNQFGTQSVSMNTCILCLQQTSQYERQRFIGNLNQTGTLIYKVYTKEWCGFKS